MNYIIVHVPIHPVYPRMTTTRRGDKQARKQTNEITTNEEKIRTKRAKYPEREVSLIFPVVTSTVGIMIYQRSC